MRGSKASAEQGVAVESLAQPLTIITEARTRQRGPVST
jgi:hypothetical protein